MKVIKRKDLMELDVAAVPTSELPRLCYEADLLTDTLKSMYLDCEDVLKELIQRSRHTLLADIEKAETEYGTYRRNVRKDMKLPVGIDGKADKTLVLRYVVDQVNAGTSIDDAFDILVVGLKKTAFDHLQDTELPIGITRVEKETSVKFTPKKNVTF